MYLTRIHCFPFYKQIPITKIHFMFIANNTVSINVNQLTDCRSNIFATNAMSFRPRFIDFVFYSHTEHH